MNRSELKQKAKNSLKGKYGEAIKLMLTYFAISLVLAIILALLKIPEDSIVSDLIIIVLGALLGFGQVSFYLKISRNEEVTYKELFSKTNLFLPFIGISVVTGIMIFLWSILLIIPGIIAALSYSLVYYIKLDNPEMSVSEVISRSKSLMKGHKLEYFILNLSFIGWSILGIFTLGILYFWLIPYMETTLANFYNKLLEEKTNF